MVDDSELIVSTESSFIVTKLYKIASASDVCTWIVTVPPTTWEDDATSLNFVISNLFYSIT